MEIWGYFKSIDSKPFVVWGEKEVWNMQAHKNGQELRINFASGASKLYCGICIHSVLEWKQNFKNLKTSSLFFLIEVCLIKNLKYFSLCYIGNSSQNKQNLRLSKETVNIEHSKQGFVKKYWHNIGYDRKRIFRPDTGKEPKSGSSIIGKGVLFQNSGSS